MQQSTSSVGEGYSTYNIQESSRFYSCPRDKEWIFLLLQEGPVVLVLRAWLKEASDSWKGIEVTSGFTD